MTTASDVVRIAEHEIGITENPPGSNINKYGQWYGVDGVPWCGCFVSYCFSVAGLPLPVQSPRGFSYCPYGVEWFKAQGRFSHTPEVGDVVFFDWCPHTPNSDAYHVGIVAQVNPDGSITTIEGNTGDVSQDNGGRVMRKQRYPETWYGFGHPSYSEANLPVIEHPSWPNRYICLTSPHMQGEDVRVWKKRMIERGWNFGTGNEDVFDRKADEVLRQFQAEKGLEVDGILGPCSWTAAWELPVTH